MQTYKEACEKLTEKKLTHLTHKLTHECMSLCVLLKRTAQIKCLFEKLDLIDSTKYLIIKYNTVDKNIPQKNAE